jgi:hypothetical protein
MKGKIVLVSLAAVVILIPLVLIAIQLNAPHKVLEVVRVEKGEERYLVTLKWYGKNIVSLTFAIVGQPPQGIFPDWSRVVSNGDVFNVSIPRYNSWLWIRYDSKGVIFTPSNGNLHGITPSGNLTEIETG